MQFLTQSQLKFELKSEMGSRRLLGAGRQQRANFCNLPGIASCSPVQRVRQVGLANLATAFDGEGVFVYG